MITEYGDILINGIDEWGNRRINGLLEEGYLVIGELALVKVADESLGINEMVFGVIPATFSDSVEIIDSIIRRFRSIRIIAEIVNILDSGLRISILVRIITETINIIDRMLGVVRIKKWLRVQVSRMDTMRLNISRMAIDRLTPSRMPLYRWIIRRFK